MPPRRELSQEAHLEVLCTLPRAHEAAARHVRVEATVTPHIVDRVLGELLRRRAERYVKVQALLGVNARRELVRTKATVVDRHVGIVRVVGVGCEQRCVVREHDAHDALAHPLLPVVAAVAALVPLGELTEVTEAPSLASVEFAFFHPARVSLPKTCDQQDAQHRHASLRGVAWHHGQSPARLVVKVGTRRIHLRLDARVDLALVHRIAEAFGDADHRPARRQLAEVPADRPLFLKRDREQWPLRVGQAFVVRVGGERPYGEAVLRVALRVARPRRRGVGSQRHHVQR
eukprot:7379496-Prymnesium_polylepis.1